MNGQLRQGTWGEPYIYEVARRIHMCASMGRQVSQARAVKEVSIVYGVHQVSKFPQSRFRVHCHRFTGKAHTNIDDALREANTT